MKPNSLDAARPRPDTLFWEVTNRCNLTCEHCYNKAFLNDKKFTLSLEEGLKRCEAVAREGFRKVVFLGGEPFADRNLFAYLEKLTSAGLSCHISTNATLISPEIAIKLAALQVALVSVSLDSGEPSLNDRVRGGGTYGRIVSGMRNLATHRRNGLPRIAIACTLAYENRGRHRKLFQLAKELGIFDIFFNKYTKVGSSSVTPSGTDHFLLEMRDICAAAKAVGSFYLYLPTMPRVADYLTQEFGIHVTAKEQTCSAVDGAILLSDDHKLYPCSMARVEHDDYGAPLNQGFAQALESEPFARFLTKRADLRASVPRICRECTYQADCATRCVLTGDQSKYHLACEALARYQASASLAQEQL